MAMTRDERNAYLREWRRLNPERVYELNHRHKPPSIEDMSEAEKEFVRERARAYYQKNKARILAYQREWQKTRKETLPGILENVTNEED